MLAAIVMAVRAEDTFVTLTDPKVSTTPSCSTNRPDIQRLFADRPLRFRNHSDHGIDAKAMLLEQESVKPMRTQLCGGVIAAVVAAFLSLAVGSAVQAQQSSVQQNRHLKVSKSAAPSGVKCKVVGNWGHCLTFRSDSTYPEGLSVYHGSN